MNQFSENLDRVLVSVVVPIFNTPQHLLDRCIESITSQTYGTIEIVMVDDGSESLEMNYLNRYEQLDSRIRIIRKQNEGVSSARNVGVIESRGDFVCFVDSDDWLEECFVEESLKLAIATSADAVVGSLVLENGDEAVIWRTDVPGRILTVEGSHLELIAGEALSSSPSLKSSTALTTVTNVVSILFRRTAIATIKFPFGVAHAEDRLYLASFFQQAQKVIFISSDWYHYEQESQSVTKDQTVSTAIKLASTVQALIEFGELDTIQNELHSSMQRASAKCILNYLKAIAIMLAKEADLKEARRILQNLLDMPGIENAISLADRESFSDAVFNFLLNKKCVSILYLSARARQSLRSRLIRIEL